MIQRNPSALAVLPTSIPDSENETQRLWDRQHRKLHFQHLPIQQGFAHKQASSNLTGKYFSYESELAAQVSNEDNQVPASRMEEEERQGRGGGWCWKCRQSGGHASTHHLAGGPAHSWEQPPPQLLDLREDLR